MRPARILVLVVLIGNLEDGSRARLHGSADGPLREVVPVIFFLDGVQAASCAVDDRAEVQRVARLKDDQMINLPDRAVRVIVDHDHTVVNDLVRLLLEGAEDSGFLFVRHDGFLSGSHTQTAYGT